MKRRTSAGLGGLPVIRDRHERNSVLPLAAAANTSAKREIARSKSASLAWPLLTPKSTVDRLLMIPRKLGSDASPPRKGWALISCWLVSCTSLRDRNSNPFWLKNGPPSGRRTWLKSLGSAANFSVRRAAADSASSGVTPSITTKVRLVCWGKAESKRAWRMRQPTLASISCSLSLFMAKFWLVYQAVPAASKRLTAITAQGQRQQKATMRSTTVMGRVRAFLADS